MDKFDIYFSGQILADKDPLKVKQAIGKFFKVDGKKLDKLFSGTQLKVKSAVDVDTAGKYRAAFRQMGALVEISSAAQSAPTPTAQPSANAKPKATAQQTENASPATTQADAALTATLASFADCHPAPAATPEPDLSDYSLAFTGMDLDESPPVPDANIDTNHLDLVSPDSPAQDSDEILIIPPMPDISHLSADAVSLADCVDEKEATPIPDISEMELVE